MSKIIVPVLVRALVNIGVVFLFFITVGYAQLPVASVYDETTEGFEPYKARTLDSIEGYKTQVKNLEFSKYGGWKARRVKATGFFRVEQIDGRWWIIDPEGYLYIHKAVNSVQMFDGYTPDDVYELLPKFGMNGTGNWTDEEVPGSKYSQKVPLAYCPKYSFVSSYKRKRKDKLPIAVFDDEFVDFCKKQAQQFKQYKDDPHVLGYFIDNELSWTYKGGLKSHLAVKDSKDKNYQAAINFLKERGVSTKKFKEVDEDAYAAVMAERYYSVVCSAVRAVDPNHMILGPRLNKSWNRSKEFMEAAGRHLDIVALNHYHRWGTRSTELENIAKWTGRPLLISEFYAMEKIPNFEEKGAGWRVENEESRGLFYEHFLTTQLEAPYMVGFHWFNFQDDYKDDNSNEPKARRGLIDIKGKSYTKLQARMKYMNDRIYDYIKYVDAKAKPDMMIVAEADAYFKYTTNYGGNPELIVKSGNEKFARRTYLRFDASSVTSRVQSAKIQLCATSAEEKLTGNYHAQWVKDNNWDELGINAKNAPDGSTLLASWNHGDDVEIDVTKELNLALAEGEKLSILIEGKLANKLEVQYGSREYPDAHAQPKLIIYYK